MARDRLSAIVDGIRRDVERLPKPKPKKAKYGWIRRQGELIPIKPPSVPRDKPKAAFVHAEDAALIEQWPVGFRADARVIRERPSGGYPWEFQWMLRWFRMTPDEWFHFRTQMLEATAKIEYLRGVTRVEDPYLDGYQAAWEQARQNIAVIEGGGAVGQYKLQESGYQREVETAAAYLRALTELQAENRKRLKGRV